MFKITGSISVLVIFALAAVNTAAAQSIEYKIQGEFQSFSPDTNRFITLQKVDSVKGKRIVGLDEPVYAAKIYVTATGDEITTVNFIEKPLAADMASRSEEDGTIRIKRKTADEAANKIGIEICRFFPDSKRVLFGCSDKVIRIFDIEKNQVVVDFPAQYDESHILISPDGKKIITPVETGYRTGRNWAAGLILWDAITGKQITKINEYHKLYPRPVFSPDSTKLLIPKMNTDSKSFSFADAHNTDVDGNGYTIINTDTGREITTLVPKFDEYHSQYYFFPDSTKVLIATTDRQNNNPNAEGLRIFDVNTGKEIVAIEGKFSEVHLSEDGSTLITFMAKGKNEAVVYDMEKFEEAGQFIWSTGALGKDFCLSPDGKKALQRPKGRLDGTAIVDTLTGEEIIIRGDRLNSSDKGISFSPDSMRALLNLDGSLVICDVSTGAVIARKRISSDSCFFSPDGKRIAIGNVASRSIKVWEWENDADERPQKLTGKAQDENTVPQQPMLPVAGRKSYEEVKVKDDWTFKGEPLKGICVGYNDRDGIARFKLTSTGETVDRYVKFFSDEDIEDIRTMAKYHNLPTRNLRTSR